MISSPGERRTEMAAVCACFFDAAGEDWTKLEFISDFTAGSWKLYLQIQGIDEDELAQDDRCSLEINGLPAIVADILNPQHRHIGETSCLRQEPFEVGEERRIVEGPF